MNNTRNFFNSYIEIYKRDIRNFVSLVPGLLASRITWEGMSW